MKNLSIFIAIFFILGMLGAQSKKPTKEETFQYIKNSLMSGEFLYNSEYDHPRYYIENLIFEDCNLTLTISYTKKSIKNKISVKIPLHQIEKIEKVLKKSNEGYICNYLIVFEAYQGEPLIYNSQEFDFIKCYIDSFVEKNDFGEISKYFLSVNKIEYHDEDSVPTRDIDKLVKAFNHLRKLCGAPEPISFD